MRAIGRSSRILFACALAAAAGACGAADGDADQASSEVGVTGSDNGSLDQGWTADVTAHYEGTSDGAGLFPYAWLVALEQADRDEPFLADANVRRFGLIPRSKTAINPDGLPVGIVRRPNSDQVAETCSACHEAEITFRGATMRIHGGQGSGQIEPFFASAFQALTATIANPAKFARFADRVNGHAADASKASLLLATAKALLGITAEVVGSGIALAGTSKLEAGPYRTDALGQGINRLAGKIKLTNLRQPNAPVSIPHVWGTPRFDWVEYNGSFEQPMARNVMSALAGGADIQLQPDGKPGLPNSVPLPDLFRIETSLNALRAPRWPEQILGPIDRDKAARGRTIYEQKAKCKACHDLGTNANGFIRVDMIPVEEVGTDPTYADNWAARTVDMNGVLGLGVISAAELGRIVTDAVMDRNYAELGVSNARRDEMNGARANHTRALRSYRARPLDGIWATAPYLHNGSVPSLSQLLLPAEKRLTKFDVGSAEMDPVNVGLVTTGGFVFDTTLEGNHNTGHSGAAYGTDLSDADRADLLEYLKTL